MSKPKTTPSHYRTSVVGQVGAVIDAVRPLWLAAAVPTMRSVRGAFARELAFIDREIENKIAREASK